MGGKGGVGKTTCAAALAIRSARSRPTLLVTTDPASSLGDVLRARVGPAPAAVPGARALDACELDAPASFRAWLARRKDVLAAIALRGTWLDRDDVGRLLELSLPGIDEIIALLEITRLAGSYAHVVIDTAPTGHTLRLLSMPALYARVAGVLNTLQAQHREIVSALRGAYREDAADDLIRELDGDARRLSGLLRDPDRARIAWVTLPEPMALEETSDALAALRRARLPASLLILNRITPRAPQPCAWHAARRRFEARALAAVPAAFPGMDVREVPQLPAEPLGIRALARLAVACRASGSRAGRTPPVERRAYAATENGRPFDTASIVKAGTQWVLLGGKGGVGKTTCAAALTVQLARERGGENILLLSSDPAHSLADVLGEPVSDLAAPLRGLPPNLHVREIDAAAGLARFRERYLASIDDAFDRFTRGSVAASADAAAFRELIDLAPPGVDEVMAIAEVADLLDARGHPYAVVITDTAPTGHALRLLETPAVLRGWIQALMAILLKYQAIVGAGDLAALLVQLSKRLRVLDAKLRDDTSTAFVIVTRPAGLPREESVRLRASLARLRIGVRAIVVNAVGAGTCTRCRARAAAEAREIARLRRELGGRGGYAIIEAPAVLPPPHGGRSLVEWLSRWRTKDP